VARGRLLSAGENQRTDENAGISCNYAGTASVRSPSTVRTIGPAREGGGAPPPRKSPDGFRPGGSGAYTRKGNHTRVRGSQRRAPTPVRHLPPQERYPFMAATEAMGRSRDNEEARRNVLRGAIRARLGGSASSAEGFEMLFALWWRVLPVEEAQRPFERSSSGLLKSRMDRRKPSSRVAAASRGFPQYTSPACLGFSDRCGSWMPNSQIRCVASTGNWQRPLCRSPVDIMRKQQRLLKKAGRRPGPAV
jgi:hypothetical protein